MRWLLELQARQCKIQPLVETQGNAPSGSREKSATSRTVLFIAYLGFISLGLPDTLVGVAWPSIRERFSLSQSSVGLIFFGTGLSYFLSSFFSGKLLGAFSMGGLLAASSALVALSGFGYAAAPLWLLFASCSLLHGLGSGAIDAGLNHYVAHHFSARDMNWLHACYSLGATLGPVIMTAVIASNVSWRFGYLTVATLLLVLAALFTVTQRTWAGSRPQTATQQQAHRPTATMIETLRRPLVSLQIILFFVYTGLEVTVGQGSFTVLTEARGVEEKTAGSLVAIYWGSIFAGRVLFGMIAERLGLDELVRWSTIASLLGTVVIALNISTGLNMAGLALAGIGLAAIFPCLMSLTPQRLGAGFATHAIGFQVSAAMLGAAALPALAGIISQRFGLESITMAAVAMALLLLFLHEAVLFRAANKPMEPRN